MKGGCNSNESSGLRFNFVFEADMSLEPLVEGLLYEMLEVREGTDGVLVAMVYGHSLACVVGGEAEDLQEVFRVVATRRFCFDSSPSTPRQPDASCLAYRRLERLRRNYKKLRTAGKKKHEKGRASRVERPLEVEPERPKLACGSILTCLSSRFPQTRSLSRSIFFTRSFSLLGFEASPGLCCNNLNFNPTSKNLR